MSHYPEPQPDPGDFGPPAGGQPSGGYPSGGHSQSGGYPSGGYPDQGGYLSGGYPSGGYPDQGGYPSGGYPQQGGYPSGGYPQSGGYPSGEMMPYDPAQPPQTGGWQAMGGPPAQSATPLATIGDITVTQTEIITPAGTAPLRGSTWSINDMSHFEERIATWAVIVGILLALFTCLLGLLLLLVKERTVTGSVQVTVRNGNFYHSTQVAAHSRPQIQHLHQQFAYIRSLASM